MTEQRADYDNPWKDALTLYFPAFIEFFFPEIDTNIDWNRGYEFLDKELQQITPVIILAHLTTQQTSKDPQGRYQSKLRIAKSLYQRGYSRQAILELLRLIEWIMTLPKNLEQNYQQELTRFEEENRMPYILSVERRALEAVQQALQKARQEDIIEVLRVRFETVPNSIEEAINHIKDESVLKTLHAQAITVGAIEEFERCLEPLTISDDREQESQEEEENQEPYFPNEETRAILARLDGIIQKGREAVIEVLRVRFENVPNFLEAAINQIDEDLVLKTLLRQAITIGSLEDFQQQIPR